MRGQQAGRRKTVNSMLTHGQTQDIVRRRKQSEINDAVVRFRIRRNQRVVWEEAQLPGNMAILFNTRGSVNIHGRIPKGSAQ